MEPRHIEATISERRARFLVFYSDLTRATTLGRRLGSGGGELVLCPLSIPVDGWIGALRPDLIVLVSSEEDGELVAACQALREGTEIPIVVLSSRNDEVLIAGVLGLGIDEFLAEPIGDRELVARLEALLRRVQRNGVSSEAMRVGDVTISYLEHAVERRGKKIQLSPIEFRLLTCLASSPGNVLTHQTLMARVWGAEYVESRHYLRLYIRYLREKLEDDATKPKLILSEWGVGYRFQPQLDADGSREAAAAVPAAR